MYYFIKARIFFFLFGLILAESKYYENYIDFVNGNQFESVDDYAHILGINNFTGQFTDYKNKFNKLYSLEEGKLREFNFLKTLLKMDHQNRLFEIGNATSSMGLNQFSDMTTNEYNNLLKVIPIPDVKHNEFYNFSEIYFNQVLPKCFDWRDRNKVTPVKYQGQCGSCWSFATTATLESAIAIKYNNFTILSEQQLIDCTTSLLYPNHANGGCKGGTSFNAFNYIKEYGIEKSDDYPYVEKDLKCLFDQSKSQFKIKNIGALGLFVGKVATDEMIMSAIYTYGPVTIDICANGDDFSHYKSGVITSDIREIGHVVVVVGWCTENGIDYWMVKNSWGKDWGDHGYVRLQRGRNLRRVNDYVYWPIL